MVQSVPKFAITNPLHIEEIALTNILLDIAILCYAIFLSSLDVEIYI